LTLADKDLPFARKTQGESRENFLHDDERSQMHPHMTRRDFVKESMLFTAGAALSLTGQASAADAKPSVIVKETMPMGKIGSCPSAE